MYTGFPKRLKAVSNKFVNHGPYDRGKYAKDVASTFNLPEKHGQLRSMPNPATILQVKEWQNCSRIPGLKKTLLKDILNNS